MALSFFPPKLLQHLKDQVESGRLQLPPPIFIDMGGEFIDLDLAEKTLTVRFPVQVRYQNPMGYMQGGMIATAIDNAIGPLSFLVAAPNVTRTLEVTYLRPVPASASHITVVARFVEQNGRELVFTADVLRDDGAKFAQARSVNILRRQERSSALSSPDNE